MIQTHILYEHAGDLRPHACSYIRHLLPLSHPANSAAFHLSWGRHYEPADVVIVERFWKPINPWSLESFLSRVRSDKCFLIYSLDDNLLDLTPDRLGWQWHPTSEGLMTVRRFAEEADGIIVSTALLADRLAELNGRIHVVPNALDERLFVKRPAPPDGPISGRKVLGYMGTVTHDADLEIISRALRNVLMRHNGGVEFQLIGGCSSPAFLKSLDGLPIRVLDVGANARYPKFVRWLTENVRWDLALAPLEATPFTRCKSDMKFLDYSALGIPGIYSQVPAYEGTVRHLETGYLVQNDSDEWEAAIECMLADDSMRCTLARNAEEYVRSNRMLEQLAHCWQEVIALIVGERRSASPTIRP
jgi:glycosyltransferase involved in cell wall biosynthesis